MRTKQIWDVVPIPAKLKLVFDRVTFSRLTVGYFVFSFIHFIVQVAFQIKAFTINEHAASFLWNVVLQGDATNSSFPVFRNGEFRLCDDVPSTLSIASCRLLWNGSQPANNTVGTSSILSLASTSSPTPISTLVASVAPPAAAAAAAQVTPSPPRQTLSSVIAGLSATPSFSAAAAQATAGNVNLKVASDSSASDSESSDDEKKPTIAKRHEFMTPKILAKYDAQGRVSVQLDGMGYNGAVADLDRTCLWALNYPVSILNNTKREDIVFIAFQTWVLGMSIVAILNESIPHTLASLLTHLLATGWAAFQIQHTATFRARYNTLISQGACAGTNLLPNYWGDRAIAELTILVLNVVALFVSAFLSWKLMKSFGWQTFKRVGASRTINRVYMMVLSLSIAIQLSVFFMVVTTGLWIDQLFNGIIGPLSSLKTLYAVVFIITLVLIFPWLIMGWLAVRRELRAAMMVFLALAVCYMIGWGLMFRSYTFRWTFATWTFFSMMAIAGLILTFLSFSIGVVCRLNFGKGLPRYLNAQETLPGDDFVPIYPSNSRDIEKVDFPSNEKPIPTWSVTFGQGQEVPVPSQMFPPAYGAGGRLGPRFSNNSAEPFETESNMSSSVTVPAVAYTHSRDVSVESRPASPTSMQYYSLNRTTSQSSTSSWGSNNKKRWVIE
ncbi:hypothetical protein HGRIS_007511 [Hohenbuehelia grisea]|uniref:Uncharacterized protein n=1 Tax=Hohenbuehelia grisea TaxID=104357 RepID=A0ABR3J524_9AGAR